MEIYCKEKYLWITIIITFSSGRYHHDGITTTIKDSWTEGWWKLKIYRHNSIECNSIVNICTRFSIYMWALITAKVICTKIQLVWQPKNFSLSQHKMVQFCTLKELPSMNREKMQGELQYSSQICPSIFILSSCQYISYKTGS